MLNLKTLNLSILLVAILVLTPSIQIILAQTANPLWLTSGVYPHGCSFTVWQEGSYFYAKDGYGYLQYSGTNGTLVYQNLESTLSNGGMVFFAKGTYPLIVINQEDMILVGEGKCSSISEIQVADGIENLIVDNIAVNGYLVNKETTTLKDIYIAKSNEDEERTNCARVVELDDHRLLCAYSHTQGGSPQQRQNDWWQKYSLDDGLTWEQGYLIQNYTANYGVFPIGFLKSGSKIFLFKLHWYSAFSHSELWFRVSTNNGQTWGADTNVTDAQHPYIPSSYYGIEITGGTYEGRLVYGLSWHVSGDKWRSSVIYSDDNGTTWIEGGQVPDNDAVTNRGFNEPCPVELSNHNIMMFLRASGKTVPQRRVYKTYSSDGGATWTTPEIVEELKSVDTTNMVKRLSWSPNVLMASWIERTSGEGETFARRPLRTALSYDDGATWVKLKTIDDLGIGDNSKNVNEPLIVPLSNGQILLVYWRYCKYDFQTPKYKDDVVSRMFNMAWMEVPQTYIQYLPYNSWE